MGEVKDRGAGARRAAFIGAALLAAVLIAGWRLVIDGGGTTGMSRFIYLKIDLPMSVFSIAAMVLVALLAKGAPPAAPRRAVAGLVAATALIGVAGVHLVHHGFAFSMDEWMTRFQAEIFHSGQLSARISEEWRGFAGAMYHSFAAVNPDSGALASNYRPGMAAIHALFDVVGAGVYAAAVMTAVSVWLASDVARRLLPQSKGAPIVAALLVAASPQALAGAFTSYAMAGHLLFNLLWLRLFLADTLRGHVLAALVGVATASLHQIHLHAFFAAPFFLALLRPFRWKLLLWYFCAYLVGHLAIIGWDAASVGAASGVAPSGVVGMLGRAASILRWPDGQEWATVFANLVRLFGWQCLALFPLLAFLTRRAAWTPMLAMVAGSVVLSFAPYPFLMPDQGHGWGYRYLHGLIGPLALLGAAGWAAAERQGLRLGRLVTLAAAATMALFAVRGALMSNLVAPFARGADAVAARAAEVVVVETYGVFYGRDLMRTDPLLRTRPIMMAMDRLTPAQAEALCARGGVDVFTASDAAAVGLITFTPPHGAVPPEYEVVRAILSAPSCGDGR